MRIRKALPIGHPFGKSEKETFCHYSLKEEPERGRGEIKDGVMGKMNGIVL